MCFGKLHFTTISRENATDLKLSTRAFALPCAHIPFIQLEEQRNALNVSTPSKKVPLTPEVKISLRARFCYRFHVMRPPTVFRTTLKGKLRCFNVRASFVCRMLLNYITIIPFAVVGYEVIITNSRYALVVYLSLHIQRGSWNNCYII